jgi:predicted nuclease of predicted toxin-antitoxin system
LRAGPLDPVAADSVKFLIDQDRSPRLAGLCRDRGHDAVHTLELGLARAEDNALLMLAECARQFSCDVTA